MILCKLPDVSAQCVIETEKYPDAGTFSNYDDVEYSQGYSQIKEAFIALTKDDILQPCISAHGFRSPDTRLILLVLFYTFSMSDISRISQLPNQSK